MELLRDVPHNYCRRFISMKSNKDLESNKFLQEGSEIQAMGHWSGDKWRKAKITHIGKDGTFDIQYDDKERRHNVKRSEIKLAVKIINKVCKEYKQ